MKNSNFFFTNLFMSAIRYGLLFVVALIVTIVGAIWVDICLYIGLGLMALYLIVCLISAIQMQRIMNSLSGEDPEFDKLMEELTTDPKAFIADAMGNYEETKKLHGQELLTLSDDDLFETVYFQNLDITEAAEDEERELELFTGARKTVYVLSLFDSEIQNGGLCQFFVNSSRVVAPYVSESLKVINATEHLAIFEDFITTNNIDVSLLDSFKILSKRGYIKQTKRYDFDSFDDKYYDLPPLQEKIVAYIKDNINEF